MAGHHLVPALSHHPPALRHDGAEGTVDPVGAVGLRQLDGSAQELVVGHGVLVPHIGRRLLGPNAAGT